MYTKRNDSFLYTCKENFFKDINPFDCSVKCSKGYQSLIEIYKVLRDQEQVDLLLPYLNEKKYLCNAWAAHLIIEFGNPEPVLQEICLNVLEAVRLDKVENYSEGC